MTERGQAEEFLNENRENLEILVNRCFDYVERGELIKVGLMLKSLQALIREIQKHMAVKMQTAQPNREGMH